MNAQQTIGIIGGGQLGRMLTLAAAPLGFKVVVLNPQANSPAAQVGALEIIGDLYDAAAMQRLVEAADFVTIEIEHLNADDLERIAKQAGVSVNPLPETIRLIQDKFAQKQFLATNAIPVAPFAEVTSEQQASELLEEFGGKMLLKTRFGAYDGRGNMVVASSKDITEAFQQFAGQKLYAEKFVPFVKELAVMVVRSIDGHIATYPVVETIHERNICLEVLAPAPIDTKLQKQAEALATQVAGFLKGAGMFGIEMFLTESGEILINEIAPRVHNSGHYTMNASRTSQFEQHIRAVTGLPLGDTSMTVPAAVMINILGERNADTELEGLDAVLQDSAASVHLYGKSPTKVDRKMGHINVTGTELADTQQRAQAARQKFKI